MSDFDVLDNSMTNRGFSDAEIEALIAGSAVAGAPTPLVDLVASLQQRSAAVPSVAMSSELTAFVASVATAPRRIDTSAAHATHAQRPTAWLAKAAALLGLVPTSLLIGATVAAAAVGGAQFLGIVEVPFLPSRGHQVEAPAPASPQQPTSIVSVIAPPSSTPAASVVATAERGPTPTHVSPTNPPHAVNPAHPRSTGPITRPINGPTLPGQANPAATTVGCGPSTTAIGGLPSGPTTSHTSVRAVACDPVTPAPPATERDRSSNAAPPTSTKSVEPGRTPRP